VERIPEHFGLPNLSAVHRGIYSHQITRPQVASLAEVVGLAAHDGDTASQELLYTAGEHLGMAASAVIEKLEMLEEGMNVYTTGGVFRAGEAVFTSFRETLRSRSQTSTVREATFSPIIGALFLALKAAGVALDETLLRTVRNSTPEAAISKQAVQNT
jgi:N-acetylglucosamine kinase-like BadF-type ATPase